MDPVRRRPYENTMCENSCATLECELLDRRRVKDTDADATQQLN